MAVEPTSPSLMHRKTWRNHLNSPWFALFDLACVILGILLGRLNTQFAGPLLLIALIPWTLRLMVGRFPFHKTGLEGWIAIFLATALLGANLAYQPGDAWSKFWLLVGGVVLFYALAGQPAENVNWAAALLSVFAAGVAVYFLLTNDWNLFPAKLAFLNPIGLWWMKVRPAWVAGNLYHNIAAGVIALSLPFSAAMVISAWRARRIATLVGLLLSAGLALSGFLMTTSRGALLALFAGCVVGMLQRVSHKSIPCLPRTQLARFKTPLILIFILAAGAAFLLLAGPVSLVENDPALSSPGSRLELFGSAIRLIADFPYTGGGLGSFPGMYSHYMLGIPDFFYLSSHNLYLTIAHEQGPLGLLALVGLYLTVLSRVLHAKERPGSWFVAASLAGLVIILLHNLVDNILDDPGFAFLLFLLPGVILAVLPRVPAAQPAAAPSPGQPGRVNSPRNTSSFQFLALGLGIAAILLLGVFRQPLLAGGYANRGALRMAQIELVGFPAPQTGAESHPAELGLAEADFQLALQFDPANRTANHRLGLLALQRNDFAGAAAFLEKAHQVDPGHRGITRALGLTYVWLGQYDQALPLLRVIPEAGRELDTYSWWWTTQNRPDLAEKAADMVNKMNAPR